MPIHDWTRVDAGIFHHVHHEWISEIARTLNHTLRGTEYYALAEQIVGGRGPDVLTLQVPALGKPPVAKQPTGVAAGEHKRASVAVATRPPKVRFHIKDAPKWYASKKKAVTVRHVSEHRVVAVLEILSPGNKDSRTALDAFVRKAQDLLSAGIHLALVDLFSPTPRDPQGIHPAAWGEDDGSIFQFDPAKPLTCASYIGSPGAEAFVHPIAVGDVLPDLPLFLTPDEYVEVPLETTYQAAFAAVPEFWQNVLNEPGS
jgi:hypothetical protein